MKSIIAPACSKWSDDNYRSYMKKFGLDPKQKISTLLGPTIVTQVFRHYVKLILPLMPRIPGMMISVILGVAGVGVFLIFVIISIRIFAKKEL